MTWGRPITMATAAVLLAAIVGQLHAFVGPTLEGAPARLVLPGTVLDVSGVEVDDVARAWVGATLERPLFRADRRPPKAPADPVAEADEPIRLTGLITGPFGNRAIFVSGQDPKPHVAVEGARVGSFLVLSIGPDRAVVESGGNVRTLRPAFVETKSPLRR